MRIICVSIVTFLIMGNALATMPAENHKFHVLGNVKYRCYAGYDGKKVFDEITKAPCDNKTYESVVIDKVISINIKDENDPEDSKELAGGWNENFEYKGRKFNIAMSLYKNPSPAEFKVHLVLGDDEPVSRQTSVFSKMKSLKEMNTLIVDYNSMGKKEEINFSVEIKPSFGK